MVLVLLTACGDEAKDQTDETGGAGNTSVASTAGVGGAGNEAGTGPTTASAGGKTASSASVGGGGASSSSASSAASGGAGGSGGSGGVQTLYNCAPNTNSNCAGIDGKPYEFKCVMDGGGSPPIPPECESDGDPAPGEDKICCPQRCIGPMSDSDNPCGGLIIFQCVEDPETPFFDGCYQWMGSIQCCPMQA